MKARLHLPLAALVAILAGCNYDAPLTTVPTRAIDERLLGAWIQPEERDWMVVRPLDDGHYAIAYGKEKAGEVADLYRAHHSEVAGLPMVSVENLQPGHGFRRHVYLAWTLSDDGRELRMRTVATKLLPEGGGDSRAQQALITAHARDAALFNPEIVFVRPAND